MLHIQSVPQSRKIIYKLTVNEVIHVIVAKYSNNAAYIFLNFNNNNLPSLLINSNH